jgi:hypothetical protein
VKLADKDGTNAVCWCEEAFEDAVRDDETAEQVDETGNV